MSMSKKDFIALADHIVKANKRASYSGSAPFSASAIDSLADFCKQQNNAFNYDRWLAYIAGECGPNGGAIGKIRISSRP